MDLKLVRQEFNKDGIFGELRDLNDKVLFSTLEHSYLNTFNEYEAKIPEGEYACIRGRHRLSDNLTPFSTFEVSHVPNHLGILFHPGNSNADSSGCILLGQGRVKNSRGVMVLMNSKTAFVQFMALQLNLESFQLTVSKEIQS